MPIDSNTQSSPDAIDSSLAQRRLALDVQKLELELRQLAAPWWRRPSFWLAALPTVLASITVIYGLSNGYFQAMSVKLENQKSALESEIKRREQELERIKLKIAELENNYSQLCSEAKDRLKPGTCDVVEFGMVAN